MSYHEKTAKTMTTRELALAVERLENLQALNTNRASAPVFAEVVREYKIELEQRYNIRVPK